MAAMHWAHPGSVASSPRREATRPCPSRTNPKEHRAIGDTGDLLPVAPACVRSFREVYDDHVVFVRRSLRRFGVADPNLVDAAQDVFLVMHRRLPHFTEQGKISTWLFRICHRIARDYRRRAHRRYEILDGSFADQRTSPDADPGERLEREENRALFRAALERLAVDQQTVFVLFELESMTACQISKLLGVPVGTVYSRLRLARRSFERAIVRRVSSKNENGGRRT